MKTTYLFIEWVMTTRFAGSYYAVLLLLVGAFYLLQLMTNDRTTGWVASWRTLYFLTLTTTFNWLALFLSYRSVPFTNFNEPIGWGGFPITCFQYTALSPGGDAPPVEQWHLFYLNFLFFAVVISTMMIVLKKKSIGTEWTERLNNVTVWLYFLLINLIGLLYVAARFD